MPKGEKDRDLLALIPSPNDIRVRLSKTYQRASFLRQLLKLSERTQRTLQLDRTSNERRPEERP